MVSDKTRRDAFIEQNLGLVHACAGRFRGRGIEYDDLYSAGCMGLVKACDNFDESRGVCFSTYAVPVILGEIKKLFRDSGTVKVSRSLKELGMRVQAAREHHMKVCGTEPTLSQLAEELNEPTENITLAIQAAQPAMSLTPENEEEDRQMDIPVESPEEALAERISLEEVLHALPEQDKQLIRLRFYGNKTQSETAKVLHTTQVQISRRERKILVQLRRRLLEDRCHTFQIKRKNWAKSQKPDFCEKYEENACFLQKGCAKIYYCQADIRQNETLQKERPNVKNR